MTTIDVEGASYGSPTINPSADRVWSAVRFLGAHPLPLWLVVMALFNLLWYGVLESFPMIDEDGAANYSSLVEAVRYFDWSITTIPIKWLEGLGQPNAFNSLPFDPFAWVMLASHDYADTFRLSHALRATVCWL